MIDRKKTRVIKVGNKYIGGDNRILVQSMTSTHTSNINATVNQIKALEEVGCDIVRVAVPDMESAKAIKEIKKQINIPLVADIHFDYRLAIEVIKNGIDKVRINPGNIGDIDNIKQVVTLAKENEVPIRIGVNAGSVQNDILEKYKSPVPEALVESALRHVKILEDLDFYNIIVSAKSHNSNDTIKIYELLSEKIDYPLHLGITHSGTYKAAIIKNCVAIGHLLLQGIGDTVRLSFTDDSKIEVTTAKEILAEVYDEKTKPEVISCPTCGRCNVDIKNLTKKVEKELQNVNKKALVAVMGCEVNGPGEARIADIGVAGGKGEYLLFRNGQIIKKVSESEVFDELKKEIEKL